MIDQIQVHQDRVELGLGWGGIEKDCTRKKRAMGVGLQK